MKTNKLFVLEGIDYSGKSTQIKLLKKDFPEAVFTREPGGTPKAEEIREYLLSESGSKLSEMKRMELFFEAREIHLKEKILPALEEGKIVISDRFDASTYAYQVKDDNLRKKFWDLRSKVVAQVVEPVYLFLFISAIESLRRKSLAKNHDLNHFDQSDLEEVRLRDLRYSIFISMISSELSIKYETHIFSGETEINLLSQKIKAVINKM